VSGKGLGEEHGVLSLENNKNATQPGTLSRDAWVVPPSQPTFQRRDFWALFLSFGWLGGL